MRLRLLSILILAILVAACTTNPTATPIILVVTATPAPPTATPAPALPTYTPPPTYTPQPTYTPYPTYTPPPQLSATPTAPLPTATFTLPPGTPTRTATVTRTPTRTRTPVTCAVPYATRLHVGGQAIVQNDTNHYVRSQPTTSGTILGHVSTGDIVDVLDGPICGNNMWWWYIRASGGLTGWSAEASGGVWWFANYTGCTSTTERITFPAGGTGRKVVATLTAPCTKSYVLRINAGQKLAIHIGGYPNPGLESLTVTNPAHATLSPSGAAGTWWYNCATTGDYTITIRGTGLVEFDIEVPPL